MIKPFVYKSLWYVSTVTWKEIEAFSEMVSNNSHPIFTEVANGQIEKKGWRELQSIGRKWTLGLNNQRPLKGLQYINAPFPSVVYHSANGGKYAILAHNNMRNLPSKSLHFLSKWLSQKGGKGHQTFKSFSCKWWSAKFTAWSSIIWILILNFFDFLPFCCTILTQNWNEHAKAQLITNVCMTCPSNFFWVV